MTTVDRIPTSRRAILRAELGRLQAPALAARLETLAEELADLQTALVYGTRRLALLATAAAQDNEERIGIEGVMALTGRSRSWVEHHGDEIPGRCQGRGPGGRTEWLKREVVRARAAGRC